MVTDTVMAMPMGTPMGSIKTMAGTIVMRRMGMDCGKDLEGDFK